MDDRGDDTRTNEVPVIAIGSRLPRDRKPCRRATPAAAWYERGVALEAADPDQAIHAYDRALAGAPDHADAHCNLGRLRHERGELAAAESHYRLALCARPEVALYWFNLGVAVEDRGGTAEAIACYRAAVARDADLLDAHYNLARLYERAGDLPSAHLAVRHLTRYRALARQPRTLSR
jgi:tetratricopeptide (TPR) repeat protein